MTSKLFPLLFFFLAFLTPNLPFGKEVVKITTMPNKGNLRILFELEKGFGVQRSANNIAELKYTTSGKTTTHKKFEGKVSLRDTLYFSSLDPIEVRYDHISPATLKIVFYYCQFKDKFCSVQRSDITLP